MKNQSNNSQSGFSDEELIEKYLDGEAVYKGSFFNVQKDRIRLPDGGIATREYICHPGAVVILAGKIDQGEDTLICAKRELEEETGYRASDWKFVTTIHNAIGYSDERLFVYLARNLEAGAVHLDDEEFIQTFRLPVGELLEWVRMGKVTDVKTVIGAFWLEKIVAGQWEAQKIV